MGCEPKEGCETQASGEARMSPEFWAILGMGSLILYGMSKIYDQLAETNNRLQRFWEDIIGQRD